MPPTPTRKLPTAYAVSVAPAPDAYDDGRLTLRGVRVSSPRLDRDREVMIPQGCRLDDFRNNPVALWSHDQKELPVGTWADAGGNCTVFVRDNDGVFGDLTFSQANPRGSVVYGLYREKVLKAFSVGFTPVAGRKISPDEVKAFTPGGSGGGAGGRGNGPMDRLPGYMHTVWDLLEISPVTIGANPDALAKCVVKGSVGGEKMPADLRRKLAEFVPGLKVHRAFPVRVNATGKGAVGGADKAAQATAGRKMGTTGTNTGTTPNRIETLAGYLAKVATHLEAPVSKTAANASDTTTGATGTAAISKAVGDAVDKAAAGAGATGTGGTATKDALSTLDDTAGGSTVDATTATLDDAGATTDDREPHEKVKDGLYDGILSVLEKWKAGEMSWDECKTAMDEYAADHSKYGDASGGEGDGEGDDADLETKDGDEDEVDDEEEAKALADFIGKAVATAIAPLSADLAAVKAKLADMPSADELAEAIATP